MSSQIEDFGTLPDGRAVQAIRLRGGGLSARVLTLGATVQDLRLDGVDHPLVLGTADSSAYLAGMRYCGAIVGRQANRISGARFALGGQSWAVDANENGETCLHGGSGGTSAQIWRIADLRPDRVLLSLVLPHGHMGFPGTLAIRAGLHLDAGGCLRIAMTATTDQPTPCNLAHHSYFNLDGAGDITGHRLRIAAAQYLPVDARMIPTGQIADVAGTAFDFRRARAIGDHGYDHSFCLSQQAQHSRPVAWLWSGDGHLRMTVETDAPGLQLYDGVHFSGQPGHDGRRYGTRAGVALETQGWPDAPNRPEFPSSILDVGAQYVHSVCYRFERLAADGRVAEPDPPPTEATGLSQI